MNLLVLKLSGEIRTFTQLQFFTLVMGLLGSLYFFEHQQYLAATFLPLISLGLVGLFDFFIHRNGEYLRAGKYRHSYEEGTVDLKNFENAKANHKITKFVVPVVMVLFGLFLLFLYFSAKAGLKALYESNQLNFFPIDFFTAVLLAVSLSLFLFGARFGKSGWGFEKPNTNSDAKPE